MQMPLTAEDIIVSIFYHIKMQSIEREKPQKITADRETLHSEFRKVKKDFPDVMKNFTFREREVFPESTQLDQALSNLDATGLISRQNLVPRYYQFEAPLEGSYKKFSKRILSDNGIDEKEIRAIALYLYDRVKGENPE